MEKKWREGPMTDVISKTEADMERRQKEEHVSEDDGRRIANMNIEGMPWYVDEISEEERIRRTMEPTLSARETRNMITSALAVSLLVALVFIVGMALFLCFCLYVWFD